MMPDFCPLTVSAVRYSMEANELMGNHWVEVALNQELMVLAPDWDAYLALEAAGKLQVIGAFLGATLVGYSVGFLNPHIHYKDLLVYANDLLYVAPEHRVSSIGLKLMKATRIAAKEAGARLLLWHAKDGTSLNAILRHSKVAKVQEIVYSEKL